MYYLNTILGWKCFFKSKHKITRIQHHWNYYDLHCSILICSVLCAESSLNNFESTILMFSYWIAMSWTVSNFLRTKSLVVFYCPLKSVDLISCCLILVCSLSKSLIWSVCTFIVFNNSKNCESLLGDIVWREQCYLSYSLWALKHLSFIGARNMEEGSFCWMTFL